MDVVRVPLNVNVIFDCTYLYFFTLLYIGMVMVVFILQKVNGYWIFIYYSVMYFCFHVIIVFNHVDCREWNDIMYIRKN